MLNSRWNRPIWTKQQLSDRHHSPPQRALPEIRAPGHEVFHIGLERRHATHHHDDVDQEAGVDEHRRGEEACFRDQEADVILRGELVGMGRSRVLRHHTALLQVAQFGGHLPGCGGVAGRSEGLGQGFDVALMPLPGREGAPAGGLAGDHEATLPEFDLHLGFLGGSLLRHGGHHAQRMQVFGIPAQFAEGPQQQRDGLRSAQALCGNVDGGKAFGHAGKIAESALYAAGRRGTNW
jgi:hypothetical protein